MPMMTENEAVEAMQEVTARARGVYREGCPKCAEHGREMDAMRAKLKAAHSRPTWVVQLDNGFAMDTVGVAIAAMLILGVVWIFAGNAPWVGRAAVVVSGVVALMVWVLWNDRRIDRVLGKEKP